MGVGEVEGFGSVQWVSRLWGSTPQWQHAGQGSHLFLWFLPVKHTSFVLTEKALISPNGYLCLLNPAVIWETFSKKKNIYQPSPKAKAE